MRKFNLDEPAVGCIEQRQNGGSDGHGRRLRAGDSIAPAVSPFD